MAAILWPMQEAGSTALQTYSAFDYYGLETPPTSATGDHRGPNEALEFYRRVYDHAIVEHTASGIHDSLQIARAFLRCSYTSGGGYVVHGSSYCMGTYQSAATVFTVTAGGAGEITVAIGGSYALPSTTYRVHTSTISAFSSTGYTRVRTSLRTLTSTTSLALRRREGSTLGGLAMAHGPFSVTIYGA